MRAGKQPIALVRAAALRRERRAGQGLHLWALLAAGALWLDGSAPAQTNLVSEGFEGVFPGAWSIGDSNPSSGLVYWKDVFTTFGSVPAHTGGWKGYCAGYSNGAPVSVAGYANDMAAYMSRSVNLAGYTGANLAFWLNIPTIETCCDRFRVYMDGTPLYVAGAATPGWVLVTLPLNAYVGAAHTLQFEFDSDFSITYEGAYLDDILVDAANQPFAAALQSLQNANYTGYVLDGDTVSGASNIQAQAVFSVENFTGTDTTYTNVLSFRLINTNGGTAHPIYDVGNTATNGSYTYNITNTLSLAAGTNFTVTNIAYIRPAAWMSQFTGFYLECTMLTNGVLAQTLTTAPANYYHFTNTVSGDTAYNVLLNLTNAGWSRTYAVQTIAGQNTFQVDAGYEVRRWDDFNLPIAAANVPLVFNCVLRDSSGNAIPLVNSNLVFYDLVNSYAFPFLFEIPVFLAGSHTLDVQPSVQLDSVNKTYYLTVTLSHTNDPLSGQVLTANTQGTTTNELLHFDGNVVFGSVGTTMTNLGAAPPVNPPGGGVIGTMLNPVGGYVTALPAYYYSGANLNVNLQANGDAVVTAGSTTLTGPAPDYGNVARVNFKRGPVTLSPSGASSDVTATLPTGFGYRLNDTNSMVIYSTLPFTSVVLDATFVPASDLVYSPAGSTIYAAEESKPVWLVANQITWHVNAGTFDVPPSALGPYYVRGNEYAYLHSVSNNLVDPPNMGDKRSNDKYWLALLGETGTPTISPDTASNALLTATFTFGRGSFRAHFPYDTLVQWGATGVMNVTNDLVPAGSGSTLGGATTVAVPYSRDCSDCSCVGAGPATPAITVTNGQFTFTLDGGLVATGTNSPVDLQWGYACPVSDYAQQALQFSSAAFHMPGVFVRGDQNLLPAVQAPTTILYSGFQASNLTNVERPLSFAYSQGLADYAGLNFRCVSDGLHGGRSTIAGQNNINWQLDGRSKYYVRAGGVTGIHEAVPGTFPSSLSLWGYAFTFTSYGLSYISSQNLPSPYDSVVDGAVTLPYPAQFQQVFSNMTFTCTGAPLSADLPPNEGFKTMAYWVADFKTLSMMFQTTNGCSPGAGYLAFAIEAFASHVPQPLYGTVGFFTNGDQIPPSFGLPGLTSRLKLPNVITMDGPNQSTYSFTPVQDAYYNTYTNSPPGPTAGWLNLFGKMPVPFFEELQLHLQTSCHTNGVAASNAPIYLSGGWPRPFTGNNNYGWLDPSPPNPNPFGTNLFDANNLGWPGGGGGLTITNYRDNQTGQFYHPRAQQRWLNLITFDYPLSWNTTLRSFKSYQEVTNDLFVLKVQHQIKYMDAKQAEIDFGAQYDGLPRISIANLAFNAIDESTGVGDAIVKAAAQPVEDVLSSGLDKMNQLLDTQMKRMMDGVFDKTVNPIIDQFYTTISNDFESLPMPQRQEFVLRVHTNTLNYFIGGGPNPAATTLTTALHDLGNGLNQAKNLVGQIRGYLREATNAIESVVGVITTTTNGQALGSNIVGLATMTNGTRPVIPKLLQSLVGDIAPQFINAVVGPAVSNAMQELDPPLSQITDTLNQTKDAISQVDAQLATAGEFTSEITNILHTLTSQLAQVSAQVSLSVTQYFAQFNYSIDDPFQHVSAADIKNFIRQQVEDQFFSTDASAQIQTALRQRLYDVDAAMKGQIDSVFQQINGALRNLISESLAQVDNSINKCLGDVSDVIGAAKISGHALINGHSLTELRIDGHFQFKVPDDMEFDAFLLIKELTSDGTPGCSSPSGKFNEITIGATHVPVSWVSTGMTADAEAKFTFDGSTPAPVNLAGQLALNGELDFEAFQLHDLAAALSFGKYENYLALKGGVKFDGYDFSGAIFFGRTCTLDPIKLIDPQVADVLGNPPFTGAYCYAQGWLPVSELVLDIPPSCIFDISAGVGAGAFFFAEGPTYGGKIFLGVSGQLLCLVSIEGDITLVGAATGIPPGDLRFKGHGHFEADLGPCPFCLKLSKDVDIRYHVPTDWHIDF
jgi:hypothetical protein